jgi:predicted RNase H-like HicB family nuclease
MTECVLVGQTGKIQEKIIGSPAKAFDFKLIGGREQLMQSPVHFVGENQSALFSFLIERSAFDALTSTPGLHMRFEPQEEGGFVVYCKEYSGAVGQGETYDEAVKDLAEAISLLREVQAEDRVAETGR